MSFDSPFNINDLEDLRLDIIYNLDNKDDLKNVLKSLQIASFKTTTVESAGFLNYLVDKIPSLHLIGKGFDIVVADKKISLGFFDSGEFIFRHRTKDEQEIGNEALLSKENLKSIDSDFNFITGLILGKLGIDINNINLEFRLSVNKEGEFKTNFTHLLSPESRLLFGQAEDANLTGVNLEMTENLLNTKVKTRYIIGKSVGLDDKPNVHCRTKMELKHNGSIDTFKFLEAMLIRLNTLINTLSGGLIVGNKY